MSDLVQCAFYVRSAAEGGSWHYDRINIAGPSGDGAMHTDQPPMVGDIIHLWDASIQGPGQCRVLSRSWLHSGWGSANWPYGKDRSTVGPMLNLIVEAAEGQFVDEVRRPEAEDEGQDKEARNAD